MRVNKEKWKRLKEDRNYLISTWGRIFSLKTQCIMRPYIHQSRANKYLRIELGGVKFMVHVLVLKNYRRREYLFLCESFPDSMIQGNHKDRNTLNPNLGNMEWVTEIDNKKHLYETQVVRWGKKEFKSRVIKN